MSAQDNRDCQHRTRLEKEIAVAEAGLDPDETAILELVRLYCKTFTEPNNEAWMAAFFRASITFAGKTPSDIAWKTCEMLQAMRCSRQSCFSFNSPTCPGCLQFMTEHERQLLGVLVAVRCGRPGEAITHAMVICEGQQTEALIAAAERLSDALGERLLSESHLTIRLPGETVGHA